MAKNKVSLANFVNEERSVVVVIESPYTHADGPRYLACCALDCLNRGEIPIAGHSLTPLALGEHVMFGKPGSEVTGRDVGLAICQRLRSFFPVRTYVDLGISQGMKAAVAQGHKKRKLIGEARRIFLAGEWPTPARLTHNFEALQG